ncbi:MAG: nicotinamide-nucleotide adenylyltransferase [Thaumarchaeota archaeon]|jgi:nicotinamide-nucleotide adenylyltransferase|nr:nicotinamide-nucleotide adenylyltransferase [Nitrososphaerota archaeon]
MWQRGLLVGRFQPFHTGHLHAVRYALEKVEELCILVGSADKSHQLDNPFTAGERVYMIKAALEEAGIDCRRVLIIPLPDSSAHSLWVASVKAAVPKFDVVFSNDPLTRRLFQEEGFTVLDIPFYERPTFSATEVRRRMLMGEPWEELVPRAVAKIICEVGGVERLKQLNQQK